MRNKIIIFVVFSLLLMICCIGCASKELEKDNEILQKENFELKEEIKVLKEKITALENSPENIYKEVMENFEENNNIKETINKLNELLTKYPTSNIVDAAKNKIEEIKESDKKEYENALVNADKKELTEEKKEVISAFINSNKNSIFIEEAKKLVKEYDEQITKEKEEELKRKIVNATKNMRTRYDEVQEITWYYNRNTPIYADINSIHLYIGKKENQRPWLRFCIQYGADRWLFIKKYIIKADEQIFEIAPEYNEIRRDNASGRIWEVYDAQYTFNEEEIIKAIINSKKTIIRYQGEDRIKDKVVSSKEKQALKNVLNAYEVLKVHNF